MKVGSQVQLQFPAEIDVLSDGGPLTITGSRKDTSVNTMDAFQAGVSGVVGALQYNFDPSHQHWHYLALDRYDLRTHDSSLTEVARDQKTGFCLVQSEQINPTNCQQKNPSALSVSETINPGFSDIYDPSRDGQYIDVTGLNGTYEFVQWVNADCRLADMGPAQHTWATVLRINATASTPTVSVTGDTPLWSGHYAGLTGAQKCLPAETVRPVVSGARADRQRPLERRRLVARADGERVQLPVAALQLRPAGPARTSPAPPLRTTCRPQPISAAPCVPASRGRSSAAASRAPRRTPGRLRSSLSAHRRPLR